MDDDGGGASGDELGQTEVLGWECGEGVKMGGWRVRGSEGGRGGEWKNSSSPSRCGVEGGWWLLSCPLYWLLAWLGVQFI